MMPAPMPYSKPNRSIGRSNAKPPSCLLGRFAYEGPDLGWFVSLRCSMATDEEMPRSTAAWARDGDQAGGTAGMSQNRLRDVQSALRHRRRHDLPDRQRPHPQRCRPLPRRQPPPRSGGKDDDHRSVPPTSTWRWTETSVQTGAAGRPGRVWTARRVVLQRAAPSGALRERPGTALSCARSSVTPRGRARRPGVQTSDRPMRCRASGSSRDARSLGNRRR
jgi:hypothetical protein